MNKQDIITELYENTTEGAITKVKLTEILETVFTEIAKAVAKDGSFRYPGFGTFKVRKRKARMGINPQTKQPLKIAASKSVGFKAAPQLRKSL